MKNTYDDYIQPPTYKDSQGSDNPLIMKLRLRIQQDLNQINGVYDTRISEAEEIKKKQLQKLEEEYNNTITVINKQRMNDILLYNEKAENHIDNLISNMHNNNNNNSQKPMILLWWEKFFG